MKYAYQQVFCTSHKNFNEFYLIISDNIFSKKLLATDNFFATKLPLCHDVRYLYIVMNIDLYSICINIKIEVWSLEVES